MIKLSTKLLIINHKMMIAIIEHCMDHFFLKGFKAQQHNKTQIPGIIISSLLIIHIYIHSNLPSLNAVTMNLKPLPISLLFISPFELVL